MASRYSNWTLQKCDQCFDKYFRMFEKRLLNNKGMSAMKSHTEWVQFYYVSSDRSITGCSISSFINSLNVKVWYRLNRNTLRGEICVRNIHDGNSSRTSAVSKGKNVITPYINQKMVFI